MMVDNLLSDLPLTLTDSEVENIHSDLPLPLTDSDGRQFTQCCPFTIN